MPEAVIGVIAEEEVVCPLRLPPSSAEKSREPLPPAAAAALLLAPPPLPEPTALPLRPPAADLLVTISNSRIRYTNINVPSVMLHDSNDLFLAIPC